MKEQLTILEIFEKIRDDYKLLKKLDGINYYFILPSRSMNFGICNKITRDYYILISITKFQKIITILNSYCPSRKKKNAYWFPVPIKNQHLDHQQNYNVCIKPRIAILNKIIRDLKKEVI